MSRKDTQRSLQTYVFGSLSTGKRWTDVWRPKYYTKAFSSPLGQKVRDFYTTTSKQVLDIHEEASRIAAAQTGHTSSTSGTTAVTAAEPAPPAPVV